MVADSIHILFGIALVAVSFQSRRPEPYLVAALAAALPDIDIFLFEPLVTNDVVTSTALTHRGFTHSIAALVVFVLLAWTVGQWLPAAIAYGSHIFADFVTGRVMLFAPVSAQTYGLSYNWLLSSVAVGVVSVVLLTAWLLVLTGDRSEASIPDPVRTLRQRTFRTVRTWQGWFGQN